MDASDEADRLAKKARAKALVCTRTTETRPAHALTSMIRCTAQEAPEEESWAWGICWESSLSGRDESQSAGV